MAARLGFAQRFVAPALAGDHPGRVVGAFALGAAIAGGVIGALTANFADARGAFVMPSDLFTFAQVPLAPPALDTHSEVAKAHKHHHHTHVALASFNPGRQPVCVRLCDGFFFPLTGQPANPTDETASCTSLCPDAPTQVYYENSSQKIEDAISGTGQPYSALPVSLRYRDVANNTCTCHRDPVSYAPLRDATLRHGDAIMTPAGFLVFQGAAGAAHSARDFTALSSAALPAFERGALSNLEKASVESRRPSVKDWLASQAAPKFARFAPAPRLAIRAQDRIRLDPWRGAIVD